VACRPHPRQYAGFVTSTLELRILTPGVVDYRAAWDEQRRIHQAVVAGETPDTVLLLEHPSVYTAGKRARASDSPVDGTPVVETDRGGEVTWHGPGQLVGYPIVRLPGEGGRPRDVVAFVRRMEQLLIDACAELGVTAGRVKGRTGVWLPADHRGPERKIASIGVRVARGVSMHGFALNCDPDLSHFERIVACGIPDATMTSLTAERGRPVTVAEAIPVVERHLPALLAP
jgi:lipoyl(octanoyl) transferase